MLPSLSVACALPMVARGTNVSESGRPIGGWQEGMVAVHLVGLPAKHVFWWNELTRQMK